MKRRTFINGAILGTVVAGGGLAWLAARDQGATVIRGILQKRLGYKLNLDEEGIERFVTDNAQSLAEERGAKLLLFSGLQPIYRHSDLLDLTPVEDYVWWRERYVIEAFLMGSDFFWDIESYEKGKLLTYDAPYDTRKNPCANPFTFLT